MRSSEWGPNPSNMTGVLGRIKDETAGSHRENRPYEPTQEGSCLQGHEERPQEKPNM